jgi:UDP-glucose 4-epimerase
VVPGVPRGVSSLTRILVTGATGYVGSRLVRELGGSPGSEVRALARRPAPFVDAEFVCADLADENEDVVRQACTGVDTIVHLAGPNEVAAAAEPDRTLAVTVAGTRRLAEAAADAGVARFVYLSTVHVYGASLVEGATITEATLPEPRHPYALARLASEHTARAVAGLEVVVLRLTNSIGAPVDPRVDRWSLVGNDLCRQAVLHGRVELKTPGLQWRDFVPLGDVCRIIAGVATSGGLGPGTYNLGLGASCTVRGLADLVAAVFEDETGRTLPVEAPPSEHRGPDPYTVSVAALAARGWAPSGSVEEAVRETLGFCFHHARAL